MALRVVVVEDDGFTRMLLCSQVRELNHDVVGDAATCPEGIASVKVTRPDVVIVDLDLGPGPTGVDLAYAVRKLVPRAGILMLSTYVDIRLIGDFRPLPVGSVFMVKRSLTEPSMVEASINLAFERGSPSEIRRLGNRATMPKLRDGQVEIMRLIACGYSNAEIARKRSLEEASVGKAIARLLGQLNLEVGPQHNARVLITQAYFGFITGSLGLRQ